MSVIRFEAPAHHAIRSSESLAAFAAALQGRAGAWALLGKYGTSGTARQAAYEVRRGLKPAFECGRFEAEARTMCGEYRVYVRYVGGGEA